MHGRKNIRLVTLAVETRKNISDAPTSVTVGQICNSNTFKGSSGKTDSTLTSDYTSVAVHGV